MGGVAMNGEEYRGKIINRKRSQQVIDFSNMKYNKITPTDIDFAIEYHSKAWIIGEVKYQSAELPFGQRLAIERFVQDVTKAGKYAIAFVVEHNVHNVDEDIMLDDCPVREYYYSGSWRNPKSAIKTREAVDIFIEQIVDKEVL